MTAVLVRLAPAAVIAAAAVVFVTPAPASAHTLSGPRPTDFRTSIDAVVPAVPGLTVRVVDLGNKLELTNRTARDVTVIGYDGEPFLRVGPDGVFENLRSPATYLNRTRAATGTVAPEALQATPTTPPDWHRVSGGHSAIWHDHRIHWMGAGLPPAVRADPGHFHGIRRWSVPLRDGAVAVSVRGSLDWAPGPSGLPWVPLILALLALAFAAVISRRAVPAVVAVVVLVAGDAAHTIAAEIARPGSSLAKTAQFLGDNFVSVLVWVFAGLTVAALARRRAEALYGIVLVGAMVALVSGVTDLSYLWSSQLPGVGPDVLGRAEVAVALGLGVGLAAGALWALRRSAPEPRTRDDAGARGVGQLVRGLDEHELDLVCSRLDAAEMIPLALREIAARASGVSGVFGSDGLVFVVLAEDEIGSHVWSLTAGPARAGARPLRVQRGAPAPARAQVRTTFPAFLQIVGGTQTLDQCAAAGRLDVVGDRALVGSIEPFLAQPEPAAVVAG